MQAIVTNNWRLLSFIDQPVNCPAWNLFGATWVRGLAILVWGGAGPAFKGAGEIALIIKP